MLTQPCRALRLTPRLNSTLQRRHFTQSAIRRDDPPVNYYQTLNLSPTASAKEIKRQFYLLSKSSHPDLHPNDPAASARFVELSSAYAVLGSSEKRAAYDRTLRPASSSTSPSSGPRGSHHSSSSSGPAGSRPPSGLSRRRSAFRGPPPSFYASGGWGAHGAKRQGYAGQTSHHASEGAGAAASGSAAGNQPPPGTGPGGATSWGTEVPHFDDRAHTRTHEGVERVRHRARGAEDRGAEAQAEAAAAAAGGGALVSFVLVAGVLVVAIGITGLLSGVYYKSSTPGPVGKGPRVMATGTMVEKRRSENGSAG